MTTSLYTLAEDFQRLHDTIATADGEVTPEVEAALEALGHIEGEKVDAYRAVVASFEAHAKACQAEAEALQAKATVALNASRRLKERLKQYMEGRGVTELKGGIWKAAIQKNGGKPPLTVLVEPEQLPTALRRVKLEADTDAIRAVLASGPQPYARLEPVGSHLRFR